MPCNFSSTVNSHECGESAERTIRFIHPAFLRASAHTWTRATKHVLAGKASGQRLGEQRSTRAGEGTSSAAPITVCVCK